MSNFEDTNSASTSGTVVGQRHANTELRTLSARPQATYVRPWDGYDDTGEITYPLMRVNFNSEFTIEGYMFDKVTNVYISGGGDGVHPAIDKIGGTYGVYGHASPLSALSAFNPFSTALSISAKDLLSLYPQFSGFELDSGHWRVNSTNTITITLSAAQNAGNIDIIILNPAGYCLLSKDLSGSTINVKV
tara:strand:- start:245 stop:814 length:570 start_codon:yes stop_codon:yes gene_type:complete